MSEEKVEFSVSDMIRLTANNSNEFMKQIADHIEVLEAKIIELSEIIESLKNS